MKSSMPSASGTSQKSWATKAAVPVSAGNPLFHKPLLWRGWRWALVYGCRAFFPHSPLFFCDQ